MIYKIVYSKVLDQYKIRMSVRLRYLNIHLYWTDHVDQFLGRPILFSKKIDAEQEVQRLTKEDFQNRIKRKNTMDGWE